MEIMHFRFSLFCFGFFFLDSVLFLISCTFLYVPMYNGVARKLKKLRTSKGDYLTKQLFSSIVPLFKMGTSLKGKDLPPEGVNSFF